MKDVLEDCNKCPYCSALAGLLALVCVAAAYSFSRPCPRARKWANAHLLVPRL